MKHLWKNRLSKNQNAINISQINQVQVPQFECKICTEKKRIDDIHQFKDCNHECCRSCATNHILTTINRSPKIECPFCGNQLNDYDIQVLVSHEDYFKIHQRLNESQYGPNMKYCQNYHTCNFGCILEEGPKLECKSCKINWCTSCNVNWHFRETCEQYQNKIKNKKIHQQVHVNDQQFYKWKERNQSIVKTCPHCKALIEKNGGCNHVTCRCGCDFCWLCGQKVNKRHLGSHFNEEHPMISIDDDVFWY